MIRSHDDLIRVEVTAAMPLTPALADFSIVNVPCNQQAAQDFFNGMWNSPMSKHVSLLLTRAGRKDRLDAISNIQTAAKAGFTYFDSVTIWYEKPSSCSNHGFLPMCETGHLFYKGSCPPDVKNTEWFGDGTSNATNLWGVTPQENEGRPATYHQKFCWETALLLLSLAKPLEYRRFIYAAELSEVEYEPLFRFCRNFNMGVQLFVSTDKEATHIIRTYADVK